jgi:hypothetical protein
LMTVAEGVNRIDSPKICTPPRPHFAIQLFASNQKTDKAEVSRSTRKK